MEMSQVKGHQSPQAAFFVKSALNHAFRINVCREKFDSDDGSRRGVHNSATLDPPASYFTLFGVAILKQTRRN